MQKKIDFFVAFYSQRLVLLVVIMATPYVFHSFEGNFLNVHLIPSNIDLGSLDFVQLRDDQKARLIVFRCTKKVVDFKGIPCVAFPPGCDYTCRHVKFVPPTPEMLELAGYTKKTGTCVVTIEKKHPRPLPTPPVKTKELSIEELDDLYIPPSQNSTPRSVSGLSVRSEKKTSRDQQTARSINADQQTARSIKADQQTARSIKADQQTARSINADQQTARSINADQQTARSIKADQQTARSINADQQTARTSRNQSQTDRSSRSTMREPILTMRSQTGYDSISPRYQPPSARPGSAQKKNSVITVYDTVRSRRVPPISLPSTSEKKFDPNFEDDDATLDFANMTCEEAMDLGTKRGQMILDRCPLDVTQHQIIEHDDHPIYQQKRQQQAFGNIVISNANAVHTDGENFTAVMSRSGDVSFENRLYKLTISNN